MSTREYYAELENNHHYIIVDEEHDRTYYCPAEEASHTLSHILNDKNKTIRRLHGELNAFKRGMVSKPIYEIFRYSKGGDVRHHVAFVDSESFANEFCDKHKDCGYGQVHITKYRNELEFARANVPTCSNCKFQKDSVCMVSGEMTTLDDYCSDWEYDE